MVWAGKQTRISWDTLSLPYSQGGFTAPNFKLYYLCAQAHYAHYWYHPIQYLPHLAVEEGDAHPIPLCYILPYKRKDIPRSEINTIQTTAEAWRQLGHMAQKLPLYAPAMPLANHPELTAMQDAGSIIMMRDAGICTMSDLNTKGHFVEAFALHY